MSWTDVGIAYNLYKWLIEIDALEDIVFYVNGLPENAVDECVRIDGTGGVPGHQFPRIEDRVQLLSRSLNKLNAQNNIQLVYGQLFNQYALTLPAYVCGGSLPTYPAVRVAQISPIQTPCYIGTDDQGRHIWTFNIVITYRRV